MEEGKPKDNFVDGRELITTLSINNICKSLELSISDLQRMRFVPEYLHPTPTSHSLSPCVCRRVSESRSATHPRVLILLHVLIRFLSFPFQKRQPFLPPTKKNSSQRIAPPVLVLLRKARGARVHPYPSILLYAYLYTTIFLATIRAFIGSWSRPLLVARSLAIFSAKKNSGCASQQD